MNVLVTGGAGFIGSHVCVKLLILGHKVIVLDNLCNSQINALQGVSKITNIDLEFEFKKEAQFIFYKGDTRNSDDLRIVFSNQRVDSVIHLAGLKSVISGYPVGIVDKTGPVKSISGESAFLILS